MWKPKKLGEVVAEREFVLRREGRRVRKVRVRFGRPVRMARPDPGDPWWCPVEMTGARPSVRSWRGLAAGTCSCPAFRGGAPPLDAAEANGKLEWLDRKEKLIFARAFVATDLEGALLNLLGGIFRAVALLSDRPASVRRAGARLERSLRALAKEVGL